MSHLPRVHLQSATVFRSQAQARLLPDSFFPEWITRWGIQSFFSGRTAKVLENNRNIYCSYVLNQSPGIIVRYLLASWHFRLLTATALEHKGGVCIQVVALE